MTAERTPRPALLCPVERCSRLAREEHNGMCARCATGERCATPGCERSAASRGWCISCYVRVHSGRIPKQWTPFVSAAERGCDVDGCDNPHALRGMCDMHHARWKRHAVAGTGDRCCDKDGCLLVHHANGLCHKHYVASRRAAAGSAEQNTTSRSREKV